jgi:hypothetical protein
MPKMTKRRQSLWAVFAIYGLGQKKSDGERCGGSRAIVARKIDDKLRAARDVHNTKVHLIEFEMKIGAVAV